LTAEAAAKRDGALAYIKTIVESKETDSCASFYDRSSQFFIALARVFQADASYTDAFLNDAMQLLIANAKAASDSNNATEIAEYIVALKLLTSENRSPAIATLISGLITRLGTFIQKQPGVAFLAGDSVFLGNPRSGQWAGREVHWYSQSQSTATALMAVMLP
jgi:hypothetical protein